MPNNNPSIIRQAFDWAVQSWLHAIVALAVMLIGGYFLLQLAMVATVKFVDTFGVFIFIIVLAYIFIPRRKRGKS